MRSFYYKNKSHEEALDDFVTSVHGKDISVAIPKSTIFYQDAAHTVSDLIAYENMHHLLLIVRSIPFTDEECQVHARIVSVLYAYMKFFVIAQKGDLNFGYTFEVNPFVFYSMGFSPFKCSHQAIYYLSCVLKEIPVETLVWTPDEQIEIISAYEEICYKSYCQKKLDSVESSAVLTNNWSYIVSSALKSAE